MKILEIDYKQLLVNKEQVKDEFNKNGCLIVRNAISIENIEKLVAQLKAFFRYAVTSAGSSRNIESLSLDQLYDCLFECQGDSAKFLLTIGKDFPEFRKVAMDDNLLAVAKLLLSTELLQSAEDNNVLRIDRPQKNLTNLPWHQDYPYNMLTMDQVTAWMPILPVDENMGRLSVVMPRHELIDIEYSDATKNSFHNSNYIKIKDLEQRAVEFDKASVEVPEVKPGDMLLIHGLLVHKSGFNSSERSRWVATSRFGAFDRSEMFERNWFTARAKYPKLFTNIHPNKCHNV